MFDDYYDYYDYNDPYYYFQQDAESSIEKYKRIIITCVCLLCIEVTMFAYMVTSSTSQSINSTQNKHEIVKVFDK